LDVYTNVVIMSIFTKKSSKKKDQAKLEEEKRLEILDKKQAEWREKRPKNFQDHAHCYSCGRAIHWGKKYCSIECKNKYEGIQKKSQSRNKYMYIVLCVVMSVVMIFMLYGGGLG